MADVELEAVSGAKRARDRLSAPLVDLPGLPAGRAVKVAVRARREDVELLSAVGTVAVTHESEALEQIERAIHGRWSRPRISGPAALDELRAGDVPVRGGQDVDDRLALGRPAQPAAAQNIADGLP